MTTQRAADIIAVDPANLPYSATLLTSAARTASPTDVQFAVPHGTVGLAVVVDATAKTSTPSVVVTIKGVTKLGIVFTILASAAITDVGTTRLTVHPDLTASPNVVAADLVPEIVIVSFAHGDADSLTYSAEAIVTP